MNWFRNFRHKFFYSPKEVAQIKEDVLIDAQCELEKQYEELEDLWDQLEGEKAHFESKVAHDNKCMAEKLTSLNIYMMDPFSKKKGVTLEYMENWDSYVDQDVIKKHLINQLVQRMDCAVPF